MHATEVNGFAPDIQAEMEKLEWCDLLIIQFPLWWFSLPAILKGWVDRVFAMGKIYGGGRWYDNGVFQGKKAMLSLTTGGPENMYTAIGINGNINEILFPINHGILRFVGFEVLPPFIAWAVAHADEEKRQAYLTEYKKRLLNIESTEPIFYPPLSDYDDRFQLKSK
ncbi:NAD(P)H-dependent oxidoreductase [Aerosakkonemataceae cyanobacterium BLCC-F154]|uniref:NAD(P)H-dependent oxidoreductase n=1 Tax=Floridaenema fluviatile BLCC-F154 TaxID=3153640 RepID=A0ABV4YI69_9CYAN